MKKEKLKFIRTFFKNRKMIGAISPSSPALAKKMLESIDFINARVIVELGPGTGVFTKIILQKMHPNCKLIVFELNATFIQNLQNTIKDERFIAVHDSAEHLKQYLQTHQLNKADYIVSSLPLTAIPETIREKILRCSHENLNDHGEYIQFQYSLLQRKLIKSIYQRQKIKFTPFNLPPAFVYICKK
jgi:phospholipid N-methyltransferase